MFEVPQFWLVRTLDGRLLSITSEADLKKYEGQIEVVHHYEGGPTYVESMLEIGVLELAMHMFRMGAEWAQQHPGQEVKPITG